MSQDIVEHIEDVNFVDALSERYLAYALSTIMARSLPDVRDGLKPVHRRLIYAMYLLKLDPQAGFKKCARVVGDVIGKFHPHGDVAVYDALVRLAQGFAVRYPLVEGQGNFGSIDGDNAAAMRYTEAKLTVFAMMLLEDLQHDVVDFRPTYDGEDTEPVVLGASFPNLLANGASGIAVGMATNIPPHNLVELCDGAMALIATPEIDTRALMSHVKGPDFPTGGVVVEDEEALHAAYETGRGSFQIRAKWEIVHAKFGAWHIVVTELPYQVQTGRLVKQIADLLEARKLPLLGDIFDESAGDVRLVLEPKNRNVDPHILMEMMFKATSLEIRYGLNLNVLAPQSVPAVMGLKQVLCTWLDHRMEVLVRCCRYHHEQIAQRMEILNGFLVVFLNIDDVIRIIRYDEAPRAALIERFSLTQRQADAILNMRLRSLRRLEEMAVREELETLGKKHQHLEQLLRDEAMRWRHITKDLREKKKIFQKHPVCARRTEIVHHVPQIDLSRIDLVEREPLTLIVSRKGWVKTLKGHHIDENSLKFKEGDSLFLARPCLNTQELCFCTSKGRVFTVKGETLPGGRGDGQALRLLMPIDQDEELVNVMPLRADGTYLFATLFGRGLILKAKSLVSHKRSGRHIVNIKNEDRVCAVCEADGDEVAILSSKNRFLIFGLHQIPVLARGQGVILQKYNMQATLRQIVVFSREKGLIWPGFKRPRPYEELEKWVGNRGTKGRLAPSWTQKGQGRLF